MNTCNESFIYFQHAFLVSGLTQMTDDWLRDMEDKESVGADFNAAFNIIDHEILLKK